MTTHQSAPSPSEPQESGLTASLPTFLQPLSQRSPRRDKQSPSPSDPEQPTPSSDPAAEDFASPSVDETPETLTGSSSPGSTKRPPKILDAGIRKGYEKTAKTVATAASAIIDARLGAGTGAFIMHEDEARDIAEPASRLAARHAPIPGGAGQATDLADGVELIVAVFGYVMAALSRRAQAFHGGQLVAAEPDYGYDDQPEDAPPPAPTPAWPMPAGMAPMVGSGS